MHAPAKIDSKISSQQLPHVKSTETVQGPNHRTGERVYPKRVLSYIQLFREGLSEKVHATIPKGIVGGFDFTFVQRNLKEGHERPWTCVCEC